MAYLQGPPGWKRRMGGYTHSSGHQITRQLDWDDPDAQPEWVIYDAGLNKVTTFMVLADAMNFVEATYELSDI